MPNNSRKTIFTTISIDKETAALVEKLCKRYSLKKSEVVKLAFGYIDKAHINPSEAPESVKSELAKINKRQDDIIRIIRHYEEEQLNPMIRATNSIALRFDTTSKTLEALILSQLETSQEKQTAVLKKLSEQFCNHADVINNQSKQINALYQIHQRNYKKLLHLIQLYSELSACGVMDSKRKENLKAEIIGIISSVLASQVRVLILAKLFSLSHEQYVTLLPKSITTAIGMGVSEELGGIVTITVAVIIITGVLGNMLAETVIKLARIEEPIAKGLALGTSAHAIGTAKAMELGEIEGAMSSLAIAVAGLLTVVGASVFAQFM